MGGDVVATLIVLALTTSLAAQPKASSVPVTTAVHVPLAPPSMPNDVLLEQIRTGTPAGRARAAWEAAGGTADDEIVAALRQAARDGDGELRQAAVWALAELGRPEAVDKPPKVLHMVRPKYPDKAFSAKVQGTVVVDVLVGEDGRVAHAEVRESIPPLDQAALDSVKAWTFSPALRGGKPFPHHAKAPVAFRIY